MASLPGVTAVEPLGGFRLRLTFNDGLVRDLDVRPVVEECGVFEALHDPEYFSTVGPDETAGTICWPNGLDLDSDVLHGDAPPASGNSYVVLAERRLRHAG
jgi:hypothetical protein